MGNTGTAAPNTATYLSFDANEVHFYGGGAKNAQGNVAEGYFFDLKKALGEARSLVFIADWSFHPMMVLNREHAPGATEFKNEDTIGFQLGEVAKQKDCLVAIHVWNHDLVGIPSALNPARDGPNDTGNVWLDRICGGTRPPRLLWRASAHIGVGMSLHQKFAVMDCPVDAANPDDPKRQLKVFMGGLDVTKGRHDFADHPNLPFDVTKLPRDFADHPTATIDPETAHYRFRTKVEWTEKGFFGGKTAKSALFNEWYNAEFFNLEEDNADALDPLLPRQTWNDIACSITGPTAWDIVREFVGRWNRRAGGPDFLKGDISDDAVKSVMDKYEAIVKDDNFAKPETPVENPKARWKGRILRSQPEKHWGPPASVPVPEALKGKFDWTLGKDVEFERSIQDFYIDTIRKAERFVYIETQYMIGSGAKWRNARGTVANGIPEAIVERTKTMIKRGQPFHTYIVMPMFPEGAPVGFSGAAEFQRRFEFETMRYMAVAIHTEAKKNSLSWFNFITFLFPARWAHLPAEPTTKGNRERKIKDNFRYMIYVHSKLMIVDDKFVILGSANLNERSLAGDRDSEICVFLEPGKGKEVEAISQVMFFRKLLWNGFFRTRSAPRFGQKTEPAPAFADDPAWDKPESGACVQSVHGTAFRNYLYFRRGLREVSLDVDPDNKQIFRNDGWLMTFPFDMVVGGLPKSSGDFGILNTNLIKVANMDEGVLSITQIRELGEILKRKCPEGDGFLPDPDGSGVEWTWESHFPSMPTGGAAE